MNTHSSGYYSIDKDYNILSYNDTADVYKRQFLARVLALEKRSASVLISRRDALHIVWNRRQSVDLRRNW